MPAVSSINRISDEIGILDISSKLIRKRQLDTLTKHYYIK